MTLNIYIIDYYTDVLRNGLNTYVAELAAGLAKYSNCVLTQVWINSNETSLKREPQNGILNIYIPKFNNLQKKKSTADLYLSEEIVKVVGRKKNAIIHLNWINHCSFAWHIKQKIDCKIILTKHCIPWRDLVATNYKEFYRLDQAFKRNEKVEFNVSQLNQEKINYEHIDHIITVTTCAKANLELFFEIDSQKITSIYNGIDFHLARKNKTGLRKKYGFLLDEKIILYAGSIRTAKGVYELVACFENYLNKYKDQNLRLIIAGDGNLSLIFNHIKKSWAKITVTGNLDKTALYDFYSMADIGVVPSFAEQCSYTAIEMMRSGLPVLVSDLDGLREIVPEDCGLRFKINFNHTGPSIDQNDFNNKLNYLLGNINETKYIAKTARESSLINYNRRQMVEKTIKVYENLFAPKTAENNTVLLQAKNITNPLITILIPCYNAQKYIQECINSVLTQSYNNFELLIIDDGSTDESIRIIESNSDRRIRLIRCRENKGITHALNTGLKMAKGKYISRMDADDRMLPERLSLQIDFLEKNSGYGMVGAWYEVIDQYGKVINRIKNASDNDSLNLDMLFYNPFAHASVTMRTDLVQKIKYHKKNLHCEDYGLWLKIASLSKVSILPFYLLQYRVHNESISAKCGKVMKQSVTTLLSSRLEEMGVIHSTQELMVHMAVGLGYGQVFFNTPEKIQELKNWLNKLCSSPTLTNLYEKKKLADFRRNILNKYNDIEHV